MIKISKKQRDYLVSKGAKYGVDIHPTGSHHSRAYYLTTNRKMMELLSDYETRLISETRR